MLPAKFGSIWPSSLIGEDFFYISQSEKRIALGGQMEPNLAGSIYVRSSIKYLRFIPFGLQIWLPRAILVSDWLMLNKCSPLKLLFGSIWPSSLIGEDFFYISQSEKRIALGGHVCWPNASM
jgi:hypothetical protein